MMSGNYGAGMSPQNFSMIAGLGGIGAGLGQLLFGGGSDPYKDAGRQLGKIPGQVNPYYDPYKKAGESSLGALTGQYGSLINDPSGMLAKFGAGYQKSPGYDWQLNQAMQAGTNAAAAGGLAGSPAHQQQAMTTATGLANQDYYNYLSKVLGLYGTGLQGLGGINQMGFNANDQMARILADTLSQKAQLGFAGQAAQNQATGQGWGNLIGGGAQLLPFLFM